jgi:CHASE3 domain sensor protein
VDITPLSILSASVIALLLIVTGGVVYLTLADWRDRRRLENEKREARRR